MKYEENYVKFMNEVIENGDAEEVHDQGKEGEKIVYSPPRSLPLQKKKFWGLLKWEEDWKMNLSLLHRHIQWLYQRIIPLPGQ